MNMNVLLTDELSGFIKAKVSSRSYTSSSEVVREALRLMEQRDHIEAEKLRWLQKGWQAGIDSGDVGEIDFDEQKVEARRRGPSPLRGEGPRRAFARQLAGRPENS